MDINDFTISKHAQERILDMALEPKEVVDCLTRPSEVIPSERYRHTDMYLKGRVVCCVARDNLTVLTVMWRNDRYWHRDIKRFGEYEGREYRGA